MAAIDFPPNPTLGQEFAAAGIMYIWNGQGWLVAPAELGGGGGGFVSKSGDTMTGDLAIHSDSPDLMLNKTASGESSDIVGMMNGLARWAVKTGDATPESGGNVGSDFVVAPSNDAGVEQAPALTIKRASGLALVKAPPVDPLGVATKGYVDGKPTPALLADVTETRAGVDNAKYVSPYGHRYSHAPAFWAGMGVMPVGPNSWTAVVGWSEVLDTDNCFNGVRFTPNVPGWYKVGGRLALPTSGTNYVGIGIWMNGALSQNMLQTMAPGTSTQSYMIEAMIRFNGLTDYVELAGLSDYAPNPTFAAGIFYGYRLFP